MMNPSTSSSPEPEKQSPTMPYSQSTSSDQPPPMMPYSPSTSSDQPPPMMPYSPYPPPYHGYPLQQPYVAYPDPSAYPVYPQQSMQSQHINNAYFNSSHFHHIYQEPKREYSFARAMLCLITILAIVITSISLFFWVVVFGDDGPKFTVESLDVPAFEIKNSTFNAMWEARLIVGNPNKRITATFEHVEGKLIYKDILVDESNVESIFNLGSNDQKITAVTFAVPSPDNKNSAGAFWLQELEEDRKKGIVVFSLKFHTLATFSFRGVWRRVMPLEIMCDDLQVQFPGDIGGGKWNGSNQDCYLAL